MSQLVAFDTLLHLPISNFAVPLHNLSTTLNFLFKYGFDTQNRKTAGPSPAALFLPVAAGLQRNSFFGAYRLSQTLVMLVGETGLEPGTSCMSIMLGLSTVVHMAF